MHISVAYETKNDGHKLVISLFVGFDPKGSSGRGVVSTCSYEARKHEIHAE